jgi:large subunit ribosomal protein L36
MKPARPEKSSRGPDRGEHTGEVLAERGHAWDEIVDLKACGALVRGSRRAARRKYLAVAGRFPIRGRRTWRQKEARTMKVRTSLRSLKDKPGSTVVRRHGRTLILNKRNPRWKARQG